MRQRTASRLAWVMVVWLCAIVVAAQAISVWAGLSSVLYAFPMMSFPVVGALIVSRQPHNTIGWIMLAIGVLWGVPAAMEVYAEYGLEHPGSLVGADVAFALSQSLWVPTIGLLGTFLILLFPDGRLPSPRWRLWGWFCVCALTLLWVLVVITPGNFPGTGYPDLENPLGIEALRPYIEPFTVLILFVPICILGCAVGLVQRFRRSRGQERMQLKWLATSGATAATIYLTILVIQFPFISQETVPLWVEVVRHIGIYVFLLIPVSIGIAVLKYRLYDIDVIINKTLVFSALAAFITVVYVAVVVGIGTALGATGGNRLELSIAATALVAVAFEPVRERVQRFANRLVYGERATPYEAMSEFTDSVAAVLSVEEVLPRMAEASAAGIGAARAKVSVFLNDGVVRSAVWPAGAEGAYDMKLEISHRGAKVGTIAIAKPPGEPLRPAERALLEDLVAQAGIALHNARLALELQSRLEEISLQADELARSRIRIVNAADTSRRRIERAIHAGPERGLKSMSAGLKQAESAFDSDPKLSTELLERLRADANDTLETLRQLARGIYPPVLRDKGLIAAIEAHVRTPQAPIGLVISPQTLYEMRYDHALESAVYFCIIEALDNVEAHSPGARAVISLEASDDELLFSVKDDGRGFDVGSTERGSGLHSMVDRVEALGGAFSVESSPGRGTAVMGRLPARALAPTA